MDQIIPIDRPESANATVVTTIAPPPILLYPTDNSSFLQPKSCVSLFSGVCQVCAWYVEQTQPTLPPAHYLCPHIELTCLQILATPLKIDEECQPAAQVEGGDDLGVGVKCLG